MMEAKRKRNFLLEQHCGYGILYVHNLDCDQTVADKVEDILATVKGIIDWVEWTSRKVETNTMPHICVYPNTLYDQDEVFDELEGKLANTFREGSK